MKNLQERLASRLLYLHLDVTEKVLLWLTYRGLKPVSEITVERRNFSQFRKGTFMPTYGENKPEVVRVKKWIENAGMYYVPEQDHSSAWHISKSEEKATLSTKILRKKDFESEYQSGVLFGFPDASAAAYAQNQVEDGSVDIVWPGQMETHKDFKDKYFLPYIFYAIKADWVDEDSLVAKKWADTIREEVPKLAKWFEKAGK